jgi:GNAT superfamily N-acetyltransferase
MHMIRLVRGDEQAAVVYELAYEFIDWLRNRYPEMNSEIDNYLEHQKFDDQISQLLIHYNPPKGECLLATHAGSPIGILMLKKLDGEICEMNRMFVRKNARGLGAGRALIADLKRRAREMGFKSMVLSALPRHHEAIALYHSEGFEIDNRPGEAENSNNAVLMRTDL